MSSGQIKTHCSRVNTAHKQHRPILTASTQRTTTSAGSKAPALTTPRACACAHHPSTCCSSTVLETPSRQRASQGSVGRLCTRCRWQAAAAAAASHLNE